jgi:glycosyltransferase involved in cell wall biosynthesis
MKVCLVLVTHNRLNYTKKCVEHILADDQSEFDLHVWDNASSDETPEFLKSLKDTRIKQVVLSKTNDGPLVAMNRVWSTTNAKFVAKLDNDCLVSPGWLRKLTEAHCDWETLGAVACWHFRPEDFDETLAGHKMQKSKGHIIFQHPWVCGSGFVMKRQTYLEMGPWQEGSPGIGTTGYFLRMALRGYTNGWYYPLILQHHMDDLFSPYCHYNDDESLKKAKTITFSLRNNNITTVEQLMEHRKMVLETLLCSSPRVQDHVGWRFKLKCRLPLLNSLHERILRLMR